MTCYLMTPGHPFRMGYRTVALEAIIERRFRLLAERGGKMSRINDWVVALLRLKDFAERKFLPLNVSAPRDQHGTN